MFRRVIGTIRHIDGSPWQTEIVFRLFPGSYDLEAQYPSERKKVISNSDGTFEVLLWCNQVGLAIASYECRVQGDAFRFDLPAGTVDADIGELRANARSPGIPPSGGGSDQSPDIVRTITQTDLTLDNVVVFFPNRNQPPSVLVINNLNQQVEASDILFLSDTAVRISLEGYTPITGQWRIRIL